MSSVPSLQYATLLMDGQEQMLAQYVDEDPEASKPTRKLVTDAVAGSFIDLVDLLAPRVVAEIGAHEASFSRQIKRRLPDSRVLAFEANPEVCERKRDQNLKAGIDYRNQCVADRAGTLEIAVPISNRKTKDTMGSLMMDTRAKRFKKFRVEAITADAATAGETNALWIDVEGAVANILAGAHRTLASCQAAYVEVEKVARWQGQALDRDVIAIMLDAGLVPVGRDIQRDWQYNIIFLRADLLARSDVAAAAGSIGARGIAALLQPHHAAPGTRTTIAGH